MMKMLLKTAFMYSLWLSSQLLQFTFAAPYVNPHLTGPHGGQIITEKGETYEVIENKKDQTLDAYLLDQDKNQRDQTLSLTLPFQTASDRSEHENKTIFFKKIGMKDGSLFYRAPLPSSIHTLAVSDPEKPSKSSRSETTDHSTGLSSYDQRLIQRVPP